jgi:hypothetical protein
MSVTKSVVQSIDRCWILISKISLIWFYLRTEAQLSTTEKIALVCQADSHPLNKPSLLIPHLQPVLYLKLITKNLGHKIDHDTQSNYGISHLVRFLILLIQSQYFSIFLHLIALSIAFSIIWGLIWELNTIFGKTYLILLVCKIDFLFIHNLSQFHHH